MVKVCVIGAGAAGITAAKQAINFGFDVIVYEQTDQVGGTWVYDPELTAHSAMYEVLLTNSPKEVMNYHDQDIQKTLPSFIGHEDMLNYLIDYAKDLPIQLEHRVDSVVREENTWKVTVYHAGKSETIDFDVVMVCNGHYFCPKYTFPYENFNGKVVHSKDYRRAGDFIDERIVVVGSGPSGIDIALQLSTTAREVYLVGRFAEFEGLPNNLTQCLTKITEASDNRVILTDGNRIENVDSVISCTGYEMKFPFLSDDLVQVTHDGMMVSPLWNHVVHVKYPTSLFFVGISLVSVTLPLFEYQARLALSFINGTGIIPSQEELENFEKKRLEDLIKRGMDGKAYHLMKDDQWDYLYDLAKYGQFEHFTNVEFIRGIYNYLISMRKNITTYKKINFIVDDEKTSFDIVPL